MENNQIVKYQNNQLQKANNVISITSKLLSKVEQQLIPYRKGDKWGFCTPDRIIVVPCVYNFAYVFIEGLAFVSLNEKNGFYNKKGDLIIPCIYDSSHICFSEGYTGVKVNGKWGFINNKGLVCIPCVFDGVEEFSEGFAGVKIDKHWGYINKIGELVVPAIYDSVYGFDDGFGEVTLAGKTGYVNISGELVIPCVYDDPGQYIEAKVRYEQFLGIVSPENQEMYKIIINNNKRGFIVKKTGKLVVPCIYQFAWDFKGDLAKVQLNYKWGYINREGVLIIPCIYDSASLGEFNEDMVSFEINKKWGFMDKLGNICVPPIYDEVYSFSEGIAWIKINDKRGWISKTGVEYWED